MAANDESYPPPQDVLPHRPPFIFVDEVSHCSDTAITAHYTFIKNDFFQGHFPGKPIVPGVILLEGLAQTLAYLALTKAGPGTVFLTGVDACRIRRMVEPGERVEYRIVIKRTRLKMVVADGQIHCDGKLVLKTELKGIIEPKNDS